MMRVDDKEVPAEGSVLDACRRAGASVPTLCHDDRMEGGGHCRACIVDVGGRYLPSCTTPARDGMTVRTDTPALAAYREDLGELMLAESAPRGRAADLLASFGARGERYPSLRGEAPRVDESHPYLRLDLGACVKCRLCESACEQIQGQFVYAFAERGSRSQLTFGPAPFASSPCVSCGACASVCPSGAVSDVDRARVAAIHVERVVRTTCGYCGTGCQLDVHVGGDDVLLVEGTRGAAVNDGHLCVKGRYAHRFVRHPERLTTPLVKQGGELVPATWDEALARIADAFARHRGKLAAISSSRCTNEENYLLQKWLRGGLGTHNVDCCARVCHAPTAAGMRSVLGTGAATNSLDDIERADVLLVAGSNATEAHPVTGARIKQAVLRGAKLIVVDPRKTELAELADVHLMLRPGSNVALFASLAAVLVEEGLVDRAFVEARTEGFAELAASLDESAPEELADISGVPAEAVRAAARLWGSARRPMSIHGLGLTEHYQGSEAVMFLCELALLVGGVGREGVGVNPLRGQNNVQGAADMGCQPDLVTGYQDPADAVVRERFERAWGRALPTEPGLTIPGMYDGARRGDVRALFVLGEDVVQTDPAAHVLAGLEALDFLVVQEIFLSETAKRADVVLPGASFFEKDGTFTNGERRIQRVRRCLAPPPGARADWEILCALMAATGYPQPFTHPAEIMDEIARVHPGFAGVSYARLDDDGLQWPVPGADHPGTRTLHTERFPIGKARLLPIEYRASPSLEHADDEYPLLLTTGRVLEHYNCGTMTRRTDNVRLHERDELELSAADAARFGVVDGGRVKVESPSGEAEVMARVSERVPTGTAFLSFHFPDSHTNALMSDVLDRISGCPEYKVTPVRVRPL